LKQVRVGRRARRGKIGKESIQGERTLFEPSNEAEIIVVMAIFVKPNEEVDANLCL
jgi:hypothetical protein